jgi:hypothetical protein
MTMRETNPQGYIRILELLDQGFNAVQVAARLRKPVKDVRLAVVSQFEFSGRSRMDRPGAYWAG